MVRKVPTAVAARVLGKSEDFIRFGLQQQVFDFEGLSRPGRIAGATTSARRGWLNTADFH